MVSVTKQLPPFGVPLVDDQSRMNPLWYQYLVNLSSTLSNLVGQVSGTTNRILITGTSTSPIVNISPSYVGQTSITTLGTIIAGIWQGTVIGPQYGGTGVNNGNNLITLGGNLTTSGAFNLALTLTAGTNLTLPIAGTLALAGANVDITSLGSGDITFTQGNLIVNQVGKGFKIKQGSNARMGTAVLVSGTVTVLNTSVTINTVIFLSRSTTGGTLGNLSTTQSAGVNFIITSSSVLDTSTINWLLIEPA